jgi:hypothetical protein
MVSGCVARVQFNGPPEFLSPGIQIPVKPVQRKCQRVVGFPRAYALSGQRSKAVKLLSELKARSTPGYSHASEVAAIYASLGEMDEAMNWLERGYAERFNPGVLIRPGFDPLRSDPRFIA